MYHDLCLPQPKTAECVQRLIDAGANIIGKAKLNPFAVWGEHVREQVGDIDYQAPWNPRADGYQYPGGINAGIGAAVAAYDWLDIGVGCDGEKGL